jgi:uncharacterized membrane protein YfcA
MPYDPGFLLLIAAIAFLGALVYGMTGFGAGLVTIPLATHFMSLPFALSVFALADLVTALRIGLQRPKDAVRAEIVRMVPFVLAGTVIGITVLVNLPRASAMLALGSFVVLYAIYALLSRPGAIMISRHWAYLAGLSGGITSSLFGAGGPPYAIYLSHRPLSKEQFRATITLTTVFSIGMRVAAFAITGLLLKAEVWVTAAVALLGVMAGLGVASWAFKRVTRELLLRLVALLLLANGISLIARGAG